MARPQQQNLLAVWIGKVELGLYAAPDYLARRGPLMSLDDVDDHRMIGFDRETPYIRAFLQSQSLPGRSAFAYRTDPRRLRRRRLSVRHRAARGLDAAAAGGGVADAGDLDRHARGPEGQSGLPRDVRRPG